jgi:adenosylcobyric acid synthase
VQAQNDGAAVIGVCGGFQMLGESVADPRGVEGDPGVEPGLGLLPLETLFMGEKTTVLTQAVVAGAGACSPERKARR